MTRAVAFVIALLALLLAFASSPAADARMYSPCESAGPADRTPGVPSDLTFHFGVGLGPDCQYGTPDDKPDYLNERGVSYTPRDWGVATDAGIPDGATVGHISTTLTLSQLNLSCLSSISVSADLIDATLSRQDSIPSESAGSPRFFELSNDGDADTVPDGANKWPAFLTVLADREGWDLDKLRSRAIGFNTTSLPGIVMFNLLTFEPGALGDSRLGYGALAILNDPTIPRTAADTFKRTCAPLVTDLTLLGTANGTPYRTNPTDGEYYFTAYSQARPDADDDGFENAIDPCPFAPDSTWSPRSPMIPGPGDPDGDGLPDSCDPFPDVPSTHSAGGVANSDEDGDGWMNRADNCPLIANVDQKDTDGDGIGDACDPNPQTVDGKQVSMCNTSEVTIGVGGIGSAYYPFYVSPCAGGSFDFDRTCFGSAPYGEVLAILSELAGSYTGTLCFPQADSNCDGKLTVGDAMRILLSGISLYILRPCEFYGGFPQQPAVA